MHKFVVVVAGCLLLGSMPQRPAANGQEPAPPRANERPRLVAQSRTAGGSAVLFSDDGKLLFIGGWDGAQVWEVATGRSLRTFRSECSYFRSMAASNDGKWLVTSGAVARLWDVTTGQEVRNYGDPDGPVSFVALSRDSRLLATSGNGAVRVWEVATGKEIRVILQEDDRLWCLALSADGKWLVTGGKDKVARLWDVATGDEHMVFRGHAKAVVIAALSVDGKRLVTGSWDKTARLWEVNTGKEIRTFGGHKEGVSAVALSRDGKWLATGCNGKTIHLWDINTGEEIRVFQGDSVVRSVTFSADGKSLASDGDGVARIWEVSSGKEVRSFQRQEACVYPVVQSGDGKWLATMGNESSAVQLWDLVKGKPARVIQLPKNSSSRFPFALSHDGTRYITVDGKTARLHDATSGMEIRSYHGHTGAIESLKLSSDDKWLVTYGKDDLARLWDVATGKETHTFPGEKRMRFSSDAKSLIAWRDGKIRLLDVATGKEDRSFKDPTKPRILFFPEALSGDGKTLATGCDNIELWNLETGTLARQWQLKPGWVSGGRFLAFSADGRWLVSDTDKDVTFTMDCPTQSVQVWDLATGKEVLAFEHPGWINAFLLSRDGKRLLAFDQRDRMTRIWDLTRGKKLCAMAAFPDGAWAVFDPDGRYDASNDGNIEAMHWVVGNETFPLKQYRDRFYDPGLLAKYMGFNQKPLRSVDAPR